MFPLLVVLAHLPEVQLSLLYIGYLYLGPSQANAEIQQKEETWSFMFSGIPCVFRVTVHRMLVFRRKVAT